MLTFAKVDIEFCSSGDLSIHGRNNRQVREGRKGTEDVAAGWE